MLNHFSKMSCVSDNLEELWKTNERHGNFTVLRLGPKHKHRMRRSPQYSLITDNLQRWIRESFASSMQSSKEIFQSSLVRDFRLDQYQPLDRIYYFLNQLINIAPVRVFDIGVTHEGRKIKAIEYRGNENDARIVWIDSTIHAREWITPSTALYVLEQLIISKAKVNLIMIPVLNPDGYDYTWTTDRLWRKNRRQTSRRRSALDECNGVDLNRNFDANFHGDGSSEDQCSQLYQGPGPFSEPESRAMANLVWSLRKNIKLAISFHSFSQIWTCPYAHQDSPSRDIRTHMEILKAIGDAVAKVNGVHYTIGPLSSVLYVGSGFSMDWIYDKAGIMHSYLVELRDKGFYGFLLPADQIIPTAMETWAGIRAAVRKVLEINI